MDIQSYELARSVVKTLGYAVSFTVIFSASYLVLNTFIRDSAAYYRLAQRILFGALGAGFFLIIYLHLQIYLALPVIDPSSGGLIGRFYVPPWVESERVFYWLALVVILASRTVKKYPQLKRDLSIAILLLAVFSIMFENPFAEPLPQFHQMYMDYYQAASVGNMQTLELALRSAVGKMFFYYNSPYMWIHPPLLFLAYAAFTVSFSAHISGLFKKETRKFGLTAAYDRAKLGYFVLTAALLLGYPWALIAWKDLPWWWDPKVNSSIMMWVLYASYLHTNLYYKRNRFRKLTNASAIIAFATLLFTFFSGYFMPGVHSS